MVHSKPKLFMDEFKSKEVNLNSNSEYKISYLNFVSSKSTTEMITLNVISLIGRYSSGLYTSATGGKNVNRSLVLGLNDPILLRPFISKDIKSISTLVRRPFVSNSISRVNPE